MMPEMEAMEGLNEDDVRADLLEKLMELMDGRIASGAMPDMAKKGAGATIEIAVGPSNQDGSDLDKDEELDEDMKQLIRSKRGY